MPCSYSYSAVASSSVIGSGSSSTKDNMPANNGRCHRSCVPVGLIGTDPISESDSDSGYDAEDNTFVVGSDIDEMVIAYKNLMALTDSCQGRDNSIQNARRPQPGSVLEMVRAAITPVKPPYDVDLVESPGLASRRCNSPCDLTDLLDTPSDEIVIQYEQRYSRTFEDTQALTAIDIECMDEETREWFISFFEINEDLSRRENPSSASSSNKLPLQELYIDIVGHCPERASALLQRRIKRRNRQLGFNNGHVFVLRYDHLNGNNDELTGEEEPVVLRRCYSDSPMTEAIYLRQNIQENFEEQLEAEWWNNFESKSWEHNGAGEGMTEPNTDARPGLAEVALALNSWSLQLVPEIVVADHDGQLVSAGESDDAESATYLSDVSFERSLTIHPAPELAMSLSGSSGSSRTTKLAIHEQGYRTFSPGQIRSQKAKFARLILQDHPPEPNDPDLEFLRRSVKLNLHVLQKQNKSVVDTADLVKGFCDYLRMNPHKAVDCIRSEASVIEHSAPSGIPGITLGMASNLIYTTYTSLFSEKGKGFMTKVTLKHLESLRGNNSAHLTQTMEVAAREACEPTYQQRAANCLGTYVQDIAFLFWEGLIEGMEEINHAMRTVKKRLGARACPKFEFARTQFWLLCINQIWEDSSEAVRLGRKEGVHPSFLITAADFWIASLCFFEAKLDDEISKRTRTLTPAQIMKARQSFRQKT